MKNILFFNVISVSVAILLLFVPKTQSSDLPPPPDGYTISPAPSSIFLGVILVEFEHDRHDSTVYGNYGYTKAEFDSMLFSRNYYYTAPPNNTTSPDDENVYGSMWDYWDEMSYGQFDLNGEVLNETNAYGEPVWVELPGYRSEYSITTVPDRIAFKNIVFDSAYAHGIDTTTSLTRRIAIVYAGDEGFGSKAIGYGGSVYFTSEKRGGYFSHIGVHCHEFGHLLGLVHIPGPTLMYWYRTLMGYGSRNGDVIAGETMPRGSCPAPLHSDFRIQLEWASIDQAHDIVGNKFNVDISFDINSFDVYRMCLRDTIINSTQYAECFYIENQLTDEGFHSRLPGAPNAGGLLIWHKKFFTASPETTLVVIDLEEADGTYILPCGCTWSQVEDEESYDLFEICNFNFFTNPNTDFADETEHDYRESDGGGRSYFAVNDISGSGSTMTADLFTCFRDVNMDSSMNIVDVLKILNYIVEIDILTEEEIEIADIRSDGKINVLDVLGFLNAFLLGICPEEEATYPAYAIFTLTKYGDYYECQLSNSMNVSGVELHFSTPPTMTSLEKTSRSSALDSISHDMSDSVKVVLYGSNGEYISSDPSNSSILNLTFSGTGDVTVTDVVLSTPDAEDIPVTIIHESCDLSSIQGTIKDYSTQNPISNALAKLYQSDETYTGQSDYSDGSGLFEISDVEQGDYYLIFTKSGYTNKRDPSYGSFTVDCGETENRGTIYMSVSCGPGAVKGYAKDSSTGSGIINALAKLYTSGGSYTGKYDYSNSSGYFYIGNVTSGNYYLMVSKTDYITERNPVSGSFPLACNETENRGNIYLDPDECLSSPTGLDGYFAPGQPYSHPKITWNAVSGATGYKVYKSLDLGPYDYLATTTTTSYTDEGFCSGGGLVDMARYKVSAVNSSCESDMTSNYKQFRGYQCAVSKDLAETLYLEGFLLLQNYPNPFNPETEITFGLAEPSFVRIVIYNILGQQISTLVEEYKTAGMYAVTWNTKDYRGQAVPAGVYLYRLEADRFAATKRMILMK